MTVYKAIKAEAEAAAELAVALATGEEPPAADDQIDNGMKQVPSILLDAGGGHQGQHQRHDHQGRVLVGGRDLHRQVRRWLQGGWHPVGERGHNARGARGRPSLFHPKGAQGMNADGSTPVLALKGVSKSFGPVQALSDVDFEVQPGEVVALVGDNGAGKSTLVKTIAGIHPADSGTISFEGKRGDHHEPDRRRGARNRDRLPGPRALRQPRRGREPLPRARGDAAGRPRCCTSSTRSAWRSRPASCSRTSP